MTPALSVPVPAAGACTTSIIVPARNEADILQQALEALVTQVDGHGKPVPVDSYEIILLANNCTDRTAETARRFARRHPGVALHVVEQEIPKDQACVGYARWLLMEEAYWRLRAKPQAVIASTDADSIVAPDWLSAMRDEFARGADAVGGRIMLAEKECRSLPAKARRSYLQDIGYHYYRTALADRLDPEAHDPFPRHHQYFGASLSLTVECYRRCGGLPHRETLEDMALHEALHLVDARIRHSPRVRVWTSARRQGRVGRGLSTQLQAWDDHTAPPLVERVCLIEQLLKWRRALRELWLLARHQERLSDKKLGRLADELQVDTREFTSEIHEAHAFGHLLCQLNLAGRWSARYPERTADQPVDEALAELRLRLA